MTAAERLFGACMRGDLEAARELVEPRRMLLVSWPPRASVHVTGKDGRTPLHTAAEQGHARLVELLVSRGADVQAKMKFQLWPPTDADPGVTPFHLACRKGSAQIVEFLLDHSAAIDANAGTMHSTPLRLACESGSTDTVAVLTRHGVTIDASDNVLTLAVEHGDLRMVELVAAAGANVDAAMRWGLTPLLLALTPERREIAAFLLDEGADVNLSRAQWTPLIKALRAGLKDLADRMIAAGADPNALPPWGTEATPRSADTLTPLHAAILQGYDDTAEALIARGADIHADSGYGTVAMLAAFSGRAGVLSRLLEMGVPVNAPSKHGRNTVMSAAEGGQEGSLKLLLEKGASVDEITPDGYTALSIARAKGRHAVVRLLEAAGARDATPRVVAATPAPRRRAVGDLPADLRQLHALLAEAHAWGRDHGWPAHLDYPQRPHVRRLGSDIDGRLGFRGMQAAAHAIEEVDPDLTSHLSQFWHGVGDWLA